VVVVDVPPAGVVDVPVELPVDVGQVLVLNEFDCELAADAVVGFIAASCVVVVVGALAVVVVCDPVVVGDNVRLTNSGRGADTCRLVVLPDPDPALLALPLDPSTVLTDVTRWSLGRNTICPSVISPVWVSPTDACQLSTAVVVAESNVSLTVI